MKLNNFSLILCSLFCIGIMFFHGIYSDSGFLIAQFLPGPLHSLDPSNTHLSFSVSLENSHQKVTITIKIKRQDKIEEVENNRTKQTKMSQ